jgi:hypothetical protein
VVVEMEVEWVAIRIRCGHGWLEFSPKAPNRELHLIVKGDDGSQFDMGFIRMDDLMLLAKMLERTVK